ncbi:MAG: pantoate--beta-alanine ligase [Deltaproteobacteria bacterium]|nr:pantoate--beta-alanine ligase [Deltaproteobacteria bacterium]
MNVVTTSKEMQSWALAEKKAGKRIAFVPTMGALHEGHGALLREGRKLASNLVLSIFVNPTQFGPNEDLNKYPRNLEGDLTKAKSCGVDTVFLPSPGEIYPEGYKTSVHVEGFSDLLCGKSRPGHFQGVATVVLKLFNIVQPDIALFGQKDFQQLRVIEQMVQDLNLPVQIVGMPIVREADGLAMSSRNQYLSPEERKSALALSSGLSLAEELIKQGVRDPQKILQGVQHLLEKSGKIRIDYVALCDPKTLQEQKTLNLPALLALACFVGSTRLIDNRMLR